MVNKVITVNREGGLRTRVAAEFVQVAGEFASQMLIEKGNKKVNAKSVMGVLSLNVPEGDTIHLFANGPDEQAAITAIVNLFDKKA